MRSLHYRQEHTQLEATSNADFRPISLRIMNRILIVRACAIGDFFLNLPALQALHRVYDDVRFTIVGYPPALKLARDFVPVDAIHSIETDPWSRLFYESIPGLTFESAVVWMKDPVVAEKLRASGVPNVLRADSFPA